MFATYAETKDEFLTAARNMGSFTKSADDYYYTLTVRFGENFTFDVKLTRDKICRKIVTWECPEDIDSLLAQTADETTVEQLQEAIGKAEDK